MKKNGIKFLVINNDSRTGLLKRLFEENILKLAETIQYEQKKGTKSTYEVLFCKNSNMVTKHRFKIVNDYYIPGFLIDSGILVKVDTDHNYPTQKAKMFVNSNVTSNNVPINPRSTFQHQDYSGRPCFFNHPQDGATSEENGKLEEGCIQ